MAKVEWVANDIYFDEYGRLHILNPQVVQRVKGMKTTNAGIEVNQESVIINIPPVPGPRNPYCPDAMCVCRRGRENPIIDPERRLAKKVNPIIDPERRIATKAKTVARSRKPTSGV